MYRRLKIFIKHNFLVRAWKETKKKTQYKNPKHIYIYSKTCRVTHIFFFHSGKFKNTVMSFKIGFFVQRHWVAFQVPGAMRWHGVCCSLTGNKSNNTDVKVYFCFVSLCLITVSESMPAHWSSLVKHPHATSDLGPKRRKKKSKLEVKYIELCLS